MPGRRVHHQTGGLVHNQQMLIFKDNVEVDLFSLPIGHRLHGHIQGDLVAHHHLVPRFALLAIDQQGACLDPVLYAGSGVLGHQLRHRLIEPHGT